METLEEDYRRSAESARLMPTLVHRLWQRARVLLPREGFYFDRPLLLFQSDDWGRIGVADEEGLEKLRAAGLPLGNHPYDFYSLETAEDLSALHDVLSKHKDSSGRSPGIGMNFIVHNLNFAPMEAEDFRRIYLLPLSDGLPRGWNRPGLLAAYREGAADGVFRPALHGSTHFCREAVEAIMAESTARAELLRTLWSAGTPYIYWRMPWVGYEYWNPNANGAHFLNLKAQRELIGASLGAFAKLFSRLPRSACAPGYRADANTHSLWAQFGIRVAQNGPGTFTPPHFGQDELLHCYRTVEFEPALNPALSLQNCVTQAESCFQRGIPAVVSMHSINLHSSIRDFRSATLQVLDKFLTALSTKYDDLLYLHDDDLYQLVQQGKYETQGGAVEVKVMKRKFLRAQAAHVGER